MRNIEVESQTLSTQLGVRSQTLSTTRSADFVPFFAEFLVFLRYVNKYVIEKLSRNFKIVDGFFIGLIIGFEVGGGGHDF